MVGGGSGAGAGGGACSLLAMDTALRRVTAKAGNSWAACWEAEYTDAPASLTIM